MRRVVSPGEAFVLIVYLAALFTMVRPGSQGPGLVQSVGNTLASIIAAATGAGAWTAGGGSATTGGTAYA